MEFVPIDLNDLKDEYISGQSLRNLAIKYGTSKLTIKRKLEKIGVNILSSSESISRMNHRDLSSNRYDLNVDEINKLYHNECLSSNQLAKKFNCSEFSILKLIKNKRLVNGEYIKNRFKPIYNNVKPDWSNKNNLYDLYYNDGMSVRDIAKKYDYDEEAIREMFIKFDIKRRSLIECSELKYRKIGYVSNLEKIVRSILDDFNIKYDKGYFGNNEYDLVIDLPKKLLIEINGLYWHFLDKKSKKDKEKYDYWYNNLREDYDFIVLWEHEFSSYESIFSRLSKIIKLDKICQISNFSNIIIKQVSKYDSELFLSKYHYLSKLRGGDYFGAFYNNILISVCVISNVVRNESLIKYKLNNHEMKELSRFCIHPIYQIKNMASHLLSKYINEYKLLNVNIKCLIAFADNTYHYGTIYKASNWIKDGSTEKSYYYEKDGMKWHKKTIWDYSKQLHIMENEFANMFGLNKINTDIKYRFLYYY